MPGDELVAGRLDRDRLGRIHGRTTTLAQILLRPRLSRGVVGLREKAVEIARGLSEPSSRVVKLPGQAQDQGRAGLAVLQERADPAHQGRPVGAIDLVADALGLGVGKHGPKRRRMENESPEVSVRGQEFRMNKGRGGARRIRRGPGG